MLRPKLTKKILRISGWKEWSGTWLQFLNKRRERGRDCVFQEHQALCPNLEQGALGEVGHIYEPKETKFQTPGYLDFVRTASFCAWHRNKLRVPNFGKSWAWALWAKTGRTTWNDFPLRKYGQDND